MLEIDDKINSESEETSVVSSVSYGIENELYSGIEKKKINTNIYTLKQKGKFPKNLTFIDAHLDEVNGISASVFLDKNTDKVMVGFEMTKVEN
ncbi:hypothetical protein [Macrococcus capreoli]|uniref:hypothetical protein n=1 Tax=Macrococcus capreoli TaxID=2982690 RepID=UPI0021D5FB40|nr:hypothetical protein [Macrococcus sp. TMW 2.2395]MCU7557614.1 hypothetical protein [Macrococcus sp. TMW 2.2395]